jgi:hypothetical protein
LTAGYKRLEQTYGPDAFLWRGPVLGFNANAELASNWHLYGLAGLGRMRATLPQSQVDAQGKTRFNAGYRLGEFGVVYTPDWESDLLRNAALTFGYRTQSVTTRGYSLGTTNPDGGPPTPNVNTGLVDTTQGFTLSILWTF